MRDADDRRNASIITHSSTRCSSTGDAGRLHDEDVRAADVLVDLERDFGVRKPMQPGGAQRDAEMLGNLLRQRRMGAARKQFQLPVNHLYRGASPRRTPLRAHSRGPDAPLRSRGALRFARAPPLPLVSLASVRRSSPRESLSAATSFPICLCPLTFDFRLVGAEGFEPSNTGSKVPRLTAWPRPIWWAQTREFITGPSGGRPRSGRACGSGTRARPARRRRRAASGGGGLGKHAKDRRSAAGHGRDHGALA